MQHTAGIPLGPERVVRRDRALVLFGIAAFTLLAWGYFVRMAAMMNSVVPETEG